MRGRGLFVDLDGTLADSLPALRAAYDAFLNHFGVASSLAEFESLNGPPLRVIVGRLKTTHALPGSEPELYALYGTILTREYERIGSHVGAGPLLREARERGWRVGIVTSAGETLARRWLEGVGLLALVEDVVGLESAGRGKPTPDPYVAALERLNCAAPASFAVEDSHQGAMAAVAAGLRTLVVGAEVPPEGWPEIEAHFRDLTGVCDYLKRAP